MALNVIETYQIEVLLDKLEGLYPSDIDQAVVSDLKAKIKGSNQDFMTIAKELGNAVNDKNKLEGLLEKYQVRVKDKEQVVTQTEQEVKHSLNMSEITDFTKDGKTYIKITYGNGQVQIIENRKSKDTKQIFEDIQKLKAINNIDGTMNAEEAFRELLKDYIEVPLDSTTFMNQDNLKAEEQSKLNFVEMNFPNAKVLASPQENIFIIKGNPDITIEVIDKDGQYSLRQLGEASFQVKEDKEQVQVETPVERPNEVKYEYTVEELQQITEGMTEEEIASYLRLHGQNPQQIMMALLMLEEAQSEKEKTQSEMVEKPKTMVLTNNRRNGKMAAFISSIYLAFLVGMVSGIIFFGMLRFILKTL